MPLYEFRCENCDKQFENIQKFSDPNPDMCPFCSKGPVVKLMSRSAFILKGTGWYETDFKGGSSTKTTTSPNKAASKVPSENGIAASAGQETAPPTVPSV